MHIRNRVLWSTLPVAVLVAATLLAADEKAASIDEALAKLGDADPAVRNAATEDLMQRADLTDEHIAVALAAGALPEQRHRLIRIVTHRFLVQWADQAESQRADEPPDDQHLQADAEVPGTGCVGVSFEIDLTDRTGRTVKPKAVVLGTAPGLPGYVVMRPGDVIMAMNGKPLPADLDPRGAKFRALIQQHQPGTAITFDIRRGSTALRKSITLVATRRLQHLYSPQSTVLKPELQRALTTHLEDLGAGIEPAEPIRVPESPAE
ncbi:MAG: hypothetical protein QF735_10500 [Phycisphaeraceae bacterium]|nr:hypothetical protein [Phycisphaeraceae bacterium]